MDFNKEWTNTEKTQISECTTNGNVTKALAWREFNLTPRRSNVNKVVLENAAEDHLVNKEQLNIRSYDLPGFPRSTFLMVFSPDGTKIASTHGNHNIYVTQLASGKHVRILKGHPRTPWCIAFHPSHSQLIASGCLGGQVRVWDLSGGSETWTVKNETVIASLAFHPRDQLLVIATYCELYFWDWSQPVPFNSISTNNPNEKVRYVSFDPLGYKLITGISVWSNTYPADLRVNQQSQGDSSTNRNPSPPNPPPPTNPNPAPTTGNAQDLIVTSYQNLVQRYDSLVRNYHRLFNQRASGTTTMDRGTDPMDVDGTEPYDLSDSSRTRPRSMPRRSLRLSARNNNGGGDADVELGINRSLSLDELSLGNGEASAETTSQYEVSVNVAGEGTSTSRQVRQSNCWIPERPSRNLVFASQASGSGPRLRNTSVSTRNVAEPENHFPNSVNIHSELRATLNRLYSDPSDNLTNGYSDRSFAIGSTTDGQGRSQSNLQSDRTLSNEINQSLYIIRDILRDSGTRLLNLVSDITSVNPEHTARILRRSPRESNVPRTVSVPRSPSSVNGSSSSSRVRTFSPSQRRSVFSSDSDTDSNPSLEVNIYSTGNSSVQSNDSSGEGSLINDAAANQPSTSTNRMEVNLTFHVDDTLENTIQMINPESINITVSNNGFRVRTNSSQDRDAPSTSRSSTPQSTRSNPSTSREEPVPGPSNEALTESSRAFHKVKLAVKALEQHCKILTGFLPGRNNSRKSPIPALKNLWELLRQRIQSLHLSERSDAAFQHQHVLDRCQVLADTIRARISSMENASNGTSSPLRAGAETQQSRNADHQSNATSRSTTSPLLRPRVYYLRRNVLGRPNLRRRWRVQSRAFDRYNEARRLLQNRVAAGRPGMPRPSNTREHGYAISLHVMRHQIRLRAMQILSHMFNMMIGCLGERGLSAQIILMLRTLKKSLGITWMVFLREIENMAHTGRRRNNAETENSQTSTSARTSRFLASQLSAARSPVDYSMPSTSRQTRSEDMVQDNEDSTSTLSSWSNSSTQTQAYTNQDEEARSTQSSSKKTESNQTDSDDSTAAESPSKNRWSGRLAVQISATNRNESMNARARRDLYMERKRLKTLHRYNPIAHPVNRRRRMPPLVRHRIPTIPAQAPRPTPTPVTTSPPPLPPPPLPLSAASEPTPGSSRSSSAFVEHQVHDLELGRALRARIQARLRFHNSRYRIRLFTPSNMQEVMRVVGQESNNNRPNAGSPAGTSAGGDSVRRASVYRSRRVPRSVGGSGGLFDQESLLVRTVPAPFAHVSEASNNEDDMPQRPHEYLQPIFFAHNGALLEESGPMSVGGLLEAGLAAGQLVDGLAPAHRIQAWDLTASQLPNISDPLKNLVVKRCKIHNDASIDISRDGKMLVALLPVDRMRTISHKLGIYSLDWDNLGVCLHTTTLEQNAVSVALSPCNRHLAVGLSSRRVTLMPNNRNNVFAVIFKLTKRAENSRDKKLLPVRILEQDWEHAFTSLNCLRWAPHSGQGLVLANNTGQLIIMS